MAISAVNTGSGVHPDAILRRQADRESSARTYARSLPIVPVRASGMVIEGADGRRYLDCLSGAGTLALGHNHPVVVEAIRRVLDSGAPLHVLDLATPEKDAFTTELLTRLPPRFAARARLHFCGPTGADAVEAAIKLARIATGRRGVAAFTGAYHGMTAGALAASGTAARAAALPGGAGAGGADIVRLPFPYGFRSPFGVGGDETARLSARYLAGLLADEASGVPAPAVLLLETVQGEGGVVPAPDAWVRSIRAITAEHGVPLAVDEVQTGVGRTGSFWGVDRSGIEPDIMIMSKAIGGSLPLAVLAYREDLDVWPPGAHTGTFRGNQLAMAAGTATLRYVAEHGLSARAEEVGARMTAELGQLRRDHPCVGDVRGRGLMIGIELVDPSRPGLDGAGAPASGTAAAVRTECLRRGLVIEVGGRGDAVVRLLPPLVITDEQAASVVTRLTDAVAAAERAGTGAGARASA